MQLSTQDYIKKALLDTQERVRDYMNYAEKIEDEKLSHLFREHAEIEGHHASHLQSYLNAQ